MMTSPISSTRPARLTRFLTWISTWAIKRSDSLRSARLRTSAKAELDHSALMMNAFPKAHRVRKRPEFLELQRHARLKVRSNSFLLLAEPGAGPSRLGIVASRRAGNSVERNRSKRLVRELFRLNPGLFPPSCDVLVIVNPTTATLSLGELRAELIACQPELVRRTRRLGRA